MGDAVRHLQLPHILHNLSNLIAGYLRLRRHVAIGPMMLAHPSFGGQQKGLVRMVPRIVNLVDERWSLVGSRCILSMALGTRGIERLFTPECLCREFRNAHINDHSLFIFFKKPAEGETQPHKYDAQHCIFWNLA